ncbi:MAG: ATP-binding protein [Boseongicola sp. SB0676_bin_33]|nr:ATP-binding protein [Boseongicola sp. SB0676_bin_33]
MHPRLGKRRIEEALKDTRVVLMSGPRQSGKTTLATTIANKDMPFLSLDDPTLLDFASSGPVGFLRGIDRAVIDEVQRAPTLLLVIKSLVDRDARPGRFLLTGSANLMMLPKVADSLAGRMEVVRLLPLSQSEIRGGQGHFLDDAFSGKSPSVGEPVLGTDLVELVLAGGYPEVLERGSWRRRQDWHDQYVDGIVQRDIREVAQVGQLAQMPKLLNVLAGHAGQLVNYSGMGVGLGMNHVTTQKYTGVFESLYLIHSLQAWHSNRLKRLIKSPKLHFLDSGLLAALKGLTLERIAKDRTAFGATLETFVVGEILKIASWSDERCSFSHFRDKDGYGVDLVMENRRGEVVGIEVKASATLSSADFSGLRKLAAACGNNFVRGIVLYDSDQAVPFGEKLSALPLASLWG